jgi:CMP-N-acetylneuraminic acid synthetase
VRALGVIPARGGSKGIPRKNLKLLGGKPLIAHTIEAANASKLLTRTVFSTEDPEIADVARSLGADVPFMRPAELATDESRAMPFMIHALHSIEAMEGGLPYDALVMLQPTAPFRTGADIDGSIELLARTGADSVISVVDVGANHPARMKFLEGDRLIDPPFFEDDYQPRQELKPMYIRNGAIYATRRGIAIGGSFKGKDCRAWIMPSSRSANIDTLLDFQIADWMYTQGLTT